MYSNYEVVLMPDKIKDFLRFIPIFPVCKTLLLNGGEAITKEELEYIKDNVVVEKSIRHPEPTDIEITIYRRLMYVSLVKRSFVCSLWAIQAKDGKCQHLYRDDVIKGVAVRVLKLSQTRFRIDAPQQPENAMKALVDHLKDVFKLPLTVMFEPFGLENYRRFLPIFPVCYRLYVYSSDKISQEELQFIKDNVVVEWVAEYHTSDT
ncbi:hypothetical protein CRE_22540 [Caenorhabditis remanei]|uniref:Uncharacterized protein n=1 Tax=Caenorhabditis remanei TaxID=31234 RepID=E3MU16_CAERE|nr:hypothetical protein CRE_22540 [Caenorhabditis remanei]